MKRNISTISCASLLMLSIQAALADDVKLNNIDPAFGVRFDQQGRAIRQASPSTDLVITQLTEPNGNIRARKLDNYKSVGQNYFVEFNSPSLINYQTQYQAQYQQAAQGSHASIGKVSSSQAAALMSHTQHLQAQQKQFIQQMDTLKLAVAVVRQFTKTLNSVVIQADEQAIEKIKRLPNVKRVSKESRFHTTLVDSVPIISAPDVWQMQDDNHAFIKGDGVSVAILDTGIDYTHPALGGCLGSECKVVDGWDFVNNDADPIDGNGHGTHVAGIVAANAEGFSGVAPNAKLHAYKVLSDDGWGSNTDIIAALEHAVDPDGDPNTDDAVDIINMSLGGGGAADGPLSVATNAAVDAGIIVVVAAGNDGNYGAINSSSPANASKAITVASSTKNDDLSYFSSKALLEENVPLKPEITAPGSEINSAYLHHELTSLSGTSMASPHVAGAIALLKQAKPALTAQQAKELIMASAVDLGLDPLAQGPGRLNIAQAFAVDTVITEGMLNLGIVDKASASWSSEASFTIKNLSDVEQTYQLSTSSDLVDAAQLTFAQKEVLVPAQGEAVVNIELVVNEVANLPTTSHEGGIYFADILINNGVNTSRLPFAFQHATLLTLKNESDAEVSVLIQNPNIGFLKWPNVPAHGTLDVMVPQQELSLLSQYYLSGNNSPELLPEGVYGQGITLQKVQINGDTELVLDASSLTDIVGINSFKDHLGQEKAFAELISAGSLMEINHSNGNLSAFALGSVDYYFVIGDLTEQVKVTYNSQVKYQDENSPENAYVYNMTYQADSQNRSQALTDVDLSQAPFFTIAFDPVLTENSDWSLFVGQRSMTSFYPNEQPEQVLVYADKAQSQAIFFSEIGQFKPLDDWDSELIASSSQVSLNGQGGLNQHDYWNGVVGSISGTEHILSPTSTFWTANFNYNDDNVQLIPASFAGGPSSFISNLNGFDFGHLGNTYQFECDQAPQDEQILAPASDQALTIELPALDCENLGINFSYDTYLDNSKYRSTIYYPLNNSVYVDAPKQIKLFEGEQRVTDQTLDKIDARIEVNFSYLDESSTQLFIQLDGQAWSELASYVINGNTLVANIDQLAGEHIANIKIHTSDYNGGYIVQTLNGFFKLGLSSGTDNDADNDGITNDLDSDNDNDGVDDEHDLFPFNSAEWADHDQDGIGDNADTDDDNDGYLDEQDAMPFDATEQFDTDADGIGNNADTDDDNDGVLDSQDAFPLDPNEQLDTDFDGIGNNSDSDDDNDFVADENDAFPLDASEQLDFDGDGIGDNADNDDDNDGTLDEQDVFPHDSAESMDTDGDGIGNNADTDDDNDGVSDANDYYPLDASRSQQPVVTSPDTQSSSGGGGSTGGVLLLVLSLLFIRKLRVKRYAISASHIEPH